MGDISDVFNYFRVHHSEQERGLPIVVPKARSHRKEILNQQKEDLAHQNLSNCDTGSLVKY